MAATHKYIGSNLGTYDITVLATAVVSGILVSQSSGGATTTLEIQDVSLLGAATTVCRFTFVGIVNPQLIPIDAIILGTKCRVIMTGSGGLDTTLLMVP